MTQSIAMLVEPLPTDPALKRLLTGMCATMLRECRGMHEGLSTPRILAAVGFDPKVVDVAMTSEIVLFRETTIAAWPCTGKGAIGFALDIAKRVAASIQGRRATWCVDWETGQWQQIWA